MHTEPNTTSKTRNRLLAAAASVAIAGAIGFGAVTSGTDPVRAQPVEVEGSKWATGFADVVEQVSPAVVSVRVEARVEPASHNGGNFSFGMPGMEDIPEDHPLYRFFKEFQDREHGDRGGDRGFGDQQRARPVSQGSGFFISGDGYLVTNNHVVQGGGEFTVIMDDGTELSAKLVGTDPRTDLAVLKVEEEREFPYVEFADDNGVRVGDWVVAVGNPFGLGGTVTAGIVSARGRDIGAGPYDDFLQIDAAVNRGNSGGPAFNLDGKVVGINTAIFSPSGGNVGIAFAIPASSARDVINDLVENGEVVRGWLGVQIQPVTDDIAESMGLKEAQGALVTESVEDGPALEAGVKTGDVITSVNGEEVKDPRELARVIAKIEPGTDVDLTLSRGGSEEKVSVKLGEYPEADQQASLETEEQPESSGSLESFGLTVAPSDDGKGGLVVTDVAFDSTAAERGIQAGDVIVAVNSTAIENEKDVAAAVKAAEEAGRSAVLFQVTREESNRFVALPIARS